MELSSPKLEKLLHFFLKKIVYFRKEFAKPDKAKKSSFWDDC